MPSSKPFLLTGFEPFGGSSINPSEQVTHALDGEIIAGLKVAGAILPVDQQRAPEVLLKAIDDTHPAAVLCLGEATRRPVISIERVAVNLLDFRIPDNAGAQTSNQPVVENGPAAYFSALPVRALLDALQTADLPAELSLTAGSYLCNQIFYTLMHTLATQQSKIPGGFIHLPALPEQAAKLESPCPSMSLETDLKAIRLVIETISRYLDK
ncbi:MAG TPA: pyroglutamyl-peptidase I [Longilinea sp.]|nr:pyroglutamyl-peptidase I [Longilinea sp.]